MDTPYRVEDRYDVLESNNFQVIGETDHNIIYKKETPNSETRYIFIHRQHPKSITLITAANLFEAKERYSFERGINFYCYNLSDLESVIKCFK